MKRMSLEYGDAMMIYCIGSVNREDTIERFTRIITHVGNDEIRDQMFVLREKISERMDDEDWAIFFPKVLRNMAVYLDHDRENFLKCLNEMRAELRAEMEQADLLESMGLKYGCGEDDED